MGEHERQPLDDRDALAGYDTVDFNAGVTDLGLRGLTLRAGVRNIFNDDVRYPVLLDLDQYDPTSPRPGYPEDYTRPDRSWWMQLSYTF